MGISARVVATSAVCLGLGFTAVALASPVQAANERIVLHSLSYENKPGQPIKFECLASPSLVGKTAQIKEVGGAFQRSVTVKKNGSCDISAPPNAKGEHNYVVVIQYKLANGQAKTVSSIPESVLVGKDPTPS